MRSPPPVGVEGPSQRCAVKEDELHAELEQQVQRDEARRRLTELQQLQRADQRRAQLQQWFADLSAHLTSDAAPAQKLASQIRQHSQHQGQAHEAPGQRARSRRQGGPAARPGHPVLTGALHCCSRASTSTSTSSPTFNCPLPRLRRPPADLNAATTDKDCDPSGAPLVGQRTMGPGSGPGLVAHVLWLYCMRLASSGVGGVRRVRLAFGRHPMHPPHT